MTWEERALMGEERTPVRMSILGAELGGCRDSWRSPNAEPSSLEQGLVQSSAAVPCSSGVSCGFQLCTCTTLHMPSALRTAQLHSTDPKASHGGASTHGSEPKVQGSPAVLPMDSV